MTNYLVADLGGTNARFALIDDKSKILNSAKYITLDFPKFEDALKKFLVECRNPKIAAACFGIAGPVNKDRKIGHFTNNNWVIDSDSIRRAFKINYILLMNDFEALSFSIDKLKSGQYKELTSSGRKEDGVTTLIGAGTGLGVCILYPFNDNHFLRDKTVKHLPLASEFCATDVDIDANNDVEVGLYDFLKKKKLGIHFESLVSGRGISTIYDFLKTKKIKHSSVIAKEIANSKERQKIIVAHALADDDLLCLETVKLFVKFYARAARNLALTTLCSEIFIAGGIAPSIYSILEDSFIELFTIHELEQYRKMLEGISIFVLFDQDASFYGAYNALLYAINN